MQFVMRVRGNRIQEHDRAHTLVGGQRGLPEERNVCLGVSDRED